MWQHHVELLCEVRERELHQEISVIVRERAIRRALRPNASMETVRLVPIVRRAAVAIGAALVSMGRRFEAYGTPAAGRVPAPPEPGP
jgi:hypothetical protein